MSAEAVRSSEPEVIYRKVVDNQGALPVVDGPWAGFYNPAISEGKVAFLAYRPAFSPLSLFAEVDGEIAHIASDGDPIPVDGRTISMNFTTSIFPVYHKGRVYWEASLFEDSEASGGIVFGTKAVIEYSDEGLRVAYDEIDLSDYAGTTLSWYTSRYLYVGSEGRIVRAFSGSGAESGSYLWLIGFDGQNLSTVNAGAALPSTTTRDTQYCSVYEEGFTTYHHNENTRFRRDHLGTLQTLDTGLDQLLNPYEFWGANEIAGNGKWFAMRTSIKLSGISGFPKAIVGWSAGQWFEIIREGSSSQDGTVITDLDGGFVLDGNSLLFSGYTAAGKALFLFRNGAVRRIFSPGDLIDGKEVSSFHIGRNALEGDQFCFAVIFSDGVRAIYTGDLSGLYTQPVNLPSSEITLTGSHTGEISVLMKEGKVYHLMRSENLKDEVSVESSIGNGVEERFTFDNSVEEPGRIFYWIEEAVFEQ